jgi:hypothetical protein
MVAGGGADLAGAVVSNLHPEHDIRGNNIRNWPCPAIPL